MLPMNKCRLFFFDCETGGLDPAVSDLVEVAAVVTDPTGERVLARYAQKVLPLKPVAPGAAKVNGYDPKVWAKEAIPLKAALERLEFLSRYGVFCAHNAPFDWGFLSAAFKEHGFKWKGGTWHKIDTVAMAVPLLHHGLVENLKLETLTRTLGIEHENAHSAYSDVCACHGLYMRLLKLYADVPKRFAAAREEKAEVERDIINVWTDGSCLGNPGPMGAGVVIKADGKRKQLSVALGEGTNNIAELRAVERALDYMLEHGVQKRPVKIHTDSSYVVGVLSQNFTIIANADLVARIAKKVEKFPLLKFVKVEGHSGVLENELADELARRASDRAKAA